VLLAAKFHGYPLERLVPVAAAVELLHTASLVHDDVIDNAATRRGHPTLNAVAGSRAPILIGDYIFAKSAATAVLGENLRVMQVFAATLMQICEGELREVLSTRQWPQSKDEYHFKIACKTASLFSLSAECGAVLSGASEEEIAALRDYGHNVGMAFQVVDDVLDIAGDEQQLGKPVGGDLRQGTVTLPIIYHLAEAPADSIVRTIVAGNNHTEQEIREAIRLIVQSPAISRSYEDARRFAAAAKQALRIFPDDEHRQALEGIADATIERAT
jgi:geranylgeranyl pyrophosphate synthase